MTSSYLIYDFETDGSDPRTCRPLQVAWQRFDLDLNPIEDSVSVYVKPAPDRLPHPKAIEVTGISMAQCTAEGISDAEVFRRLHDEVNRPGTCSFGWNTRRFDNEILRFGFWRNFLPSYDHEWKQACDAWDIIDLARAACAMRPDGLTWPTHDDGTPTFKLDQLAPANGFDHSDAHDAMADVSATLHIARMLRSKIPKLWKHARNLADTETVRSLVMDQPFVHVTSRIRASDFCTAPFGMIAKVPGRKNEIMAWNLRQDPTMAIELDTEALQRRIFTREDELPPGETRFGVKKVKLNASPIVAPLGVLTDENLERLHLDLSSIERHHRTLAEHRDALSKKLIAVFDTDFDTPADADDALYGGSFPSNTDVALGRSVHDTAPGDLHVLERKFRDHRFKGLLLHFIARNHADQLTDMQRVKWAQRTAQRLLKPPSPKANPDWPTWCGEMQAAIESARGPLRTVLHEAHAHGLQVAAGAGLTQDF